MNKISSKSLTSASAARELLRRKRARENLIDYCRYTKLDYRPGEHHYELARLLERVENGECKRLRVHMGPRFGKSETATRRFTGWFLGRNPKRNVIGGSYGQNLASDFGRDIRNIMQAPEHLRLFPKSGVSDSSSSAERWHTTQGGMYVAAGVGTAITGRGAHILNLDDLVKDRDEADSSTARERVWRWYLSTAYTRLERDLDPEELEDDSIWFDYLDQIGEGDAKPFEGAIILTSTRWHEDDIAGRLEKAELDGGEQWEVFEFPSIVNENEPGERSLWPAKFPLERLKAIRGTMGAHEWSALHRQKPTAEEGDYFKREWVQFYGETDKPKHLRVYGASDYATKAGSGDYTVHIVVGVCPDDNIYVLDVWRGQAATDVWIDRQLDLVTTHNPMMWAEEKGVILNSVGPFLEKRMRERRVYFAREGLASVSDKPTHARSIQGRMAMGKVFLPERAPWVPEFIDELLRFPADPDDQVDAFGKIGRMLDTMVGGRLPKPKPKRRDRWDKAFAEQDSGEEYDWRTA